MTVFNHRFHPTVLREYDIRGIVGQTLKPEDAFAIGRCFGSIVVRGGGKRAGLWRTAGGEVLGDERLGADGAGGDEDDVVVHHGGCLAGGGPRPARETTL